MKKKIKYSYNRDKALSLIMDESSYENWQEAEEDVKLTETFVNSAFDDYEGLNKLDDIDFAFCIPTRASRFTESYWSEVYDFVPGFKYLNRTKRFQILSCMPPLKIVSYGKPGEPSRGAVIFVPIFMDMPRDYRNKILLRRQVTKRINDSVNFAHFRLGARYIGLGATLPKLTNFGKSIKSPVITTTGHAGTVWLMKQTFESVVSEYFTNNQKITVGFIGAGSIGAATLENISNAHPDYNYQIYDIRPEMNKNAQQKMAERGRSLVICKSNKELIQTSDVILSAVTSKIDIKGIDLTGKVIIDDSQPGQFVRDEVFSAGGILIWVVGTDMSKTQFASRRGAYSYGPNGLHSPNDLWGCEAEVAAISFINDSSLAVHNHVGVDDVKRIGEVFQQLHIVPAKFQSYGELNHK